MPFVSPYRRKPAAWMCSAVLSVLLGGRLAPLGLHSEVTLIEWGRSEGESGTSTAGAAQLCVTQMGRHSQMCVPHAYIMQIHLCVNASTYLNRRMLTGSHAHAVSSICFFYSRNRDSQEL